MGLGFPKMKKREREKMEKRKRKKYTWKWRQLGNIEKKQEGKKKENNEAVVLGQVCAGDHSGFGASQDARTRAPEPGYRTWPHMTTQTRDRWSWLSFPWAAETLLGAPAVLCERGLFPPPQPRTSHTRLTPVPTTRNWAIISNSLLSSSYAQQLLNFGGNFQKILSVSLSEIACPDAL